MSILIDGKRVEIEDFPCTLTEREGIHGWCEWHGMYHTGRMEPYALGNDEASKRMRQIWTQQRNNEIDKSLPKTTPHLPQYDDCPYRGDELKGWACHCKAFRCSKHGRCSTQPRAMLKLCQKCNDYPVKDGVRKSLPVLPG